MPDRTWTALQAYRRGLCFRKPRSAGGKASGSAGHALLVRRNSQFDDARRRADAVHPARRRARQLSAADVRGHPGPGSGRTVEPQAVPSAHAASARSVVGGRRQIRHRLPRPAVGTREPGRRTRTGHPGVPIAQPQHRLHPAAVGTALHRRPRGRTVRDLHEDPPLAGGRLHRKQDPRAQHVNRPVAAGSAAVLQRRAAFENALRGAQSVAQSDREPARRCRRRGTIATQCRKSVVQHSNPQRRRIR